MRIDLVFEPCQLSLRVLGLLLLELLPEPPHPYEMADAHCHSRHDAVEQEKHESPREEANPCLAGHLRHLFLHGEIAEEEPVVQAQNQHQVAEGEEPILAPEEQKRRQEIEVGKIDGQRRPEQLPHHEHGCGGRLPVAGAEQHDQGEEEQYGRPHAHLCREEPEVFCLYSSFLHWDGLFYQSEVFCLYSSFLHRDGLFYQSEHKSTKLWLNVKINLLLTVAEIVDHLALRLLLYIVIGHFRHMLASLSFGIAKGIRHGEGKTAHGHLDGLVSREVLAAGE